MSKRKLYKAKTGLSLTGYRADSPDRFNDYNIIPSGDISMHNVLGPVLGIGRDGKKKLMQPDKKYKFKGPVLEIPIGKEGWLDELPIAPKINSPLFHSNNNRVSDNLKIFGNSHWMGANYGYNIGDLNINAGIGSITEKFDPTFSIGIKKKFKYGGNKKWLDLPKYQITSQVSVNDTTNSASNRVIGFETTMGASGGKPIPSYAGRQQDYLSIVDKIPEYGSAANRTQVGDWLWRAGWDWKTMKPTIKPKNYIVGEYIRKYKTYKPEDWDESWGWTGRKNSNDSEINKMYEEVKNLSEDEQQLLINNAKDWFFKNRYTNSNDFYGKNPDGSYKRDEYGAISSDYKSVWGPGIRNMFSTNIMSPFVKKDIELTDDEKIDYNEYYRRQTIPKKAQGGIIGNIYANPGWLNNLPKAQKGKTIYVTDPKDPGLIAYGDSLSYFNRGVDKMIEIKSRWPNVVFTSNRNLPNIYPQVHPKNFQPITTGISNYPGFTAAETFAIWKKPVDKVIYQAKPTQKQLVIMEEQRKLRKLGHYHGRIDGDVGDLTRQAREDYNNSLVVKETPKETIIPKIEQEPLQELSQKIPQEISQELPVIKSKSDPKKQYYYDTKSNRYGLVTEGWWHPTTKENAISNSEELGQDIITGNYKFKKRAHKTTKFMYGGSTSNWLDRYDTGGSLSEVDQEPLSTDDVNTVRPPSQQALDYRKAITDNWQDINKKSPYISSDFKKKYPHMNCINGVCTAIEQITDKDFTENYTGNQKFHGQLGKEGYYDINPNDEGFEVGDILQWTMSAERVSKVGRLDYAITPQNKNNKVPTHAKVILEKIIFDDGRPTRYRIGDNAGMDIWETETVSEQKLIELYNTPQSGDYLGYGYNGLFVNRYDPEQVYIRTEITKAEKAIMDGKNDYAHLYKGKKSAIKNVTSGSPKDTTPEDRFNIHSPKIKKAILFPEANLLLTYYNKNYEKLGKGSNLPTIIG